MLRAIEADETAQSIRDSTVASVLAFFLITVMMLLVFRGYIVPLLAAGSLLVGITMAKTLAWSVGLPLVPVNHLEGHIYAAWLLDPDNSWVTGQVIDVDGGPEAWDPADGTGVPEPPRAAWPRARRRPSSAMAPIARTSCSGVTDRP